MDYRITFLWPRKPFDAALYQVLGRLMMTQQILSWSVPVTELGDLETVLVSGAAAPLAPDFLSPEIPAEAYQVDAL